MAPAILGVLLRARAVENLVEQGVFGCDVAVQQGPGKRVLVFEMIEKGLTYDDVLLIPNYNHYESRKVVRFQSQPHIDAPQPALPSLLDHVDILVELVQTHAYARGKALGHGVVAGDNQTA